MMATLDIMLRYGTISGTMDKSFSSSRLANKSRLQTKGYSMSDIKLQAELELEARYQPSDYRGLALELIKRRIAARASVQQYQAKPSTRARLRAKQRLMATLYKEYKAQQAGGTE